MWLILGICRSQNKTQVILSHFKGVKNLYKIFKNKKIEKFIQIGSSRSMEMSSLPKKKV